MKTNLVLAVLVFGLVGCSHAQVAQHEVAGDRSIAAAKSTCAPGEKMIYIDRAEGGNGPTCIKKVKKAAKAKTELPCPEESLSYIDHAEGGTGFYCECPQDKIVYIDKAEGGHGLSCAQ